MRVSNRPCSSGFFDVGRSSSCPSPIRPVRRRRRRGGPRRRVSVRAHVPRRRAGADVRPARRRRPRRIRSPPGRLRDPAPEETQRDRPPAQAPPRRVRRSSPRSRSALERMRGLGLRVGRHRSCERRPRLGLGATSPSRSTPTASLQARRARSRRRCSAVPPRARRLLDALTDRAEALGKLVLRATTSRRGSGTRSRSRRCRSATRRPKPLLSRRRATRTRRARRSTKSGKLAVKASAGGTDYVRTADGALAGAVVDGAVVLGSAQAVELSLDGRQGRRDAGRASALPQRGRRAAEGRASRPPTPTSTRWRRRSPSSLGGGTTAGLLQTLLTGQGDAIAATLIPETGRAADRGGRHGHGQGHRGDPGEGRSERGDHHASGRLVARARRERRRADAQAAAPAPRLRRAACTAIGLNLVLSRLESSRA